MKRARLTARQWVGYAGFALAFLSAGAVAVWGGDILQAGLDPQVPFQTYRPPPAPDYTKDDAWALRDQRLPISGQAAVFFVHSTTYDGGREWNGPIDDGAALGYLRRVVLPNYAAPFARAGSVSAPLYRQASLYTRLTLRDDARDARAFAYRDVAAAFDVFLQRHPTGPIVIAGVEQGAELLDRLLRERIAPDAALARRLVAAYLIDAIVVADRVPRQTPPCRAPDQTGCVVAWSDVREGLDESAANRRLRRALVWNDSGRLVDLGDRKPLCVNPMLGRETEEHAPSRIHRGATNASSLEWEARPALMAREVGAVCRRGILRAEYSNLESFRARGTWAERRKSRQYNLFYGDIEHDVEQRLRAWSADAS
ncbi:hypothetical protein ASG17_09605 [Brevundimonas sp. Leaf363]|uniref:DUF3089 domain-containing protein n=1 Tax=Brevundimonas sp. Leaf363 TaxID=1736353 RepID=UPI0006FE552D|nr:DUF3089 domain-containing protein [Brevundimonas sp. Leaf363]KQS56255.1 hypothetical protein ASG17_09605 [Brevundimonas sp. Leaf363]